MLEKDPYLAQDCWKFLIGFLKKNFDFLKEYDVNYFSVYIYAVILTNTRFPRSFIS